MSDSIDEMEEKESAQGVSKKTLIISIVLAVILTIGIAAGLYFGLLKGSQTDSSGIDETMRLQMDIELMRQSQGLEPKYLEAYKLLQDGNAVDEKSAASTEDIQNETAQRREASLAEVSMAVEPLYHKIERLVMNANSETYNYVQMSLVFKTFNPTMVELLGKIDVEIRHALETEVRDAEVTDFSTNKGLGQFKERLMVRLNGVLKEAGMDVKYIEDIYFTEVLVE